MNEVDKEWFDAKGLMRAYRGLDSTNDILHHVYWLLVSNQKIGIEELGKLLRAYKKTSKWL